MSNGIITSLALSRATKAVSCRISLRAPFISRLDLCCSFLSSFCALFPFLLDLLDLEKGSKLQLSQVLISPVTWEIMIIHDERQSKTAPCHSK